jgi:hypothetical protein
MRVLYKHIHMRKEMSELLLNTPRKVPSTDGRPDCVENHAGTNETILMGYLSCIQ